MSSGISKLAAALQNRMIESGEQPAAIDFGSIKADGSLVTDLFQVPIPKGDYIESSNTFKAGDRVLVAWIDQTPVVIDTAAISGINEEAKYRKWYSGVSSPNTDVGSAGDFYLNTETLEFYTRDSGGWNLQGVLGGSSGTGLTLGEGVDNAYYGDKGKIAHDHSQSAHAPANANYYVHPATHPPAIIAQDTNNRFVTDAEKTAWNAKAGTNVATTSINGLMSSTDKTKLDGVETGATADMTAAEILTAVKTVDGPASGLDADTLDGNHASAFATAAQGTKADDALPAANYTAADVLTKIKTVDGAGSGLDADTLDGNHASAFATAAQGTKADDALPAANYTANDVLTKIKTVDGASSGLDADLLDGQHGSYYAPETITTIGTLISGAIEKTTPVDADMFGFSDSAASNVFKKITWSSIKSVLKTYFDTLYNKYVHPNHSGDVTSTGDGATAIATNAATNAKLADMAVNTIKGRATAGTGDPEDLSAAQVRTILNVADGANNYTHPATHPPAIIAQDASNRFVTDTEKATWNGKASTAVATTSANGLMSSGDKTKLDGIATGANNYAHPTGDGNLHVPATSTTNNGKVLKAGATAGDLSWGTLAKGDVGLGSVDNTSDASKPISTATQTALNGKANTSHAHAISDTTGLQTALDGKASTTVATTGANGLMSLSDKTKLDGIEAGATADMTAAEILTAVKTVDGSTSGLDADLLDGLHAASFSLATHNHDSAYEPKNTNIQTHISNTTNPHSVTKTQVGLGNVDNTSDANKPISTATQTALNGKADTSHTHADATQGVSGFMSAADKLKLDGIDGASGMTAAEILTAIKTVDGSDSGLDADLLDGQHGSYFRINYNAVVRRSVWSKILYATNTNLFGSFMVTVSHTRGSVVVGNTFMVTFGHSNHGQITQLGSHGYSQIQARLSTTNANDVYLELYDSNVSDGSDDNAYTVWIDNICCAITPYDTFTDGSGSVTILSALTTANNEIIVDGNKVWHQGNDGASSGLDADLLDGLDGSGYQKAMVKGSGTIPTTGWTANTGDYPLKVNVAITGTLTTDYVMVDVANDSVDVAQAAELSPNVTEYAGGITFYCKTTPTASIPFNYTRLR